MRDETFTVLSKLSDNMIAQSKKEYALAVACLNREEKLQAHKHQAMMDGWLDSATIVINTMKKHKEVVTDTIELLLNIADEINNLAEDELIKSRLEQKTNLLNAHCCVAKSSGMSAAIGVIVTAIDSHK